MNTEEFNTLTRILSNLIWTLQEKKVITPAEILGIMIGDIKDIDK